MLKEYAEALPALRDCVAQTPNLRSGHSRLAMTCAQIGQMEEARLEAAEVLRMQPNFSISGMAKLISVFKGAQDAEHYFDGLRKTGQPSSSAHCCREG